MRSCIKMLEAKWRQGKHVCVGLDSDFSSMPAGVSQRKFNREIVRATKDVVCAYKPNLAFYLGLDMQPNYDAALHHTIADIREIAPDVPIILDAKLGDAIRNTNAHYMYAVFEALGADAITLNPYPGQIAFDPFLERKDKLSFFLCRTSNEGAGEFQDLNVAPKEMMGEELPVYAYVAYRVNSFWNKNGNCALVVGTNPDMTHEIQNVRTYAPLLPLLIPGVGPQGGDLKKTVEAARQRFIISSSRGVIYASRGIHDYAHGAREEVFALDSKIRGILR